MAINEAALKRAQESASLAVATDHSDRPSVIYDRAPIQAYLSDEAVVRKTRHALVDVYEQDMVAFVAGPFVLRAIGGR